MGGLIIKKMLSLANESPDECDNQFVKNTKGVVFYSTPHKGTHVAKLSKASKLLFFPTVEVEDLDPDSPQLSELHQSFKDLVSRQRFEVVSFGETKPTPYMGLDITFVPAASSDPGLGQYHQVPLNHINICKPENKRSILYYKVAQMIESCL